MPDAERRLGHLLSILEDDEFRFHTKCFVLPEEREVIRDLGAWLLGIDPTQYTTERLLDALGALWDLARAHVGRAESESSVAAHCEAVSGAAPESPSEADAPS